MVQFVNGRWYGRPLKAPLYVLPYNIKVISERPNNRYVLCYIGAHRFFPNSKISKEGRQTVQRSRIVMSSMLGRALGRNEHVHHKNEKVHDDRPRNLKLISAADHNRHHKLGSKHSEKVRAKIGLALKVAYQEERHSVPDVKGPKNPFFGKKHTKATRQKMSRAKRRI